MPKKLILDTTDDLWNKVVEYKIKKGLPNNNSAVEQLMRIGTESIDNEDKNNFVSANPEIEMPLKIQDKINQFYKTIPTTEKKLGRKLIVLQDKKSDSFYSECHIFASEISKLCDFKAAIDPEFQEEFKANRNLDLKNSVFESMEDDAFQGRQFSDLIVEYNTEYAKDTPLKIFGGQHRIRAITDAFNKKGESRPHGTKVYFGLNKDQREEIARISNTNIAVSPDLLDRLEEQKLEPAGKLRNWATQAGLLEKGTDFGEKKGNAYQPTVRMLRTFIVNFYKGKHYKGSLESESITPYLCQPAGGDEEYLKIFKSKNFESDSELTNAGVAFGRMHQKQLKTGGEKKENKLKALNLAIIAAWAFSAGLLQNETEKIGRLYSLGKDISIDPPLDPIILAKAKYKHDPANYRGLGARTGPTERGRLLELFLAFSKSGKNKIDSDMARKAILRYQAKLDLKNSS